MNEKIKEILGEVLQFEKGVYDKIEDASLIELGMNSLNAIEIVVYLEDAFGIEISDEDLMIDNLSSVSRICELLERYGVKS